MTLDQLSRGVENLNRGTGRSRRRLSQAVAALLEARFMSVEKPPHFWWGRTFTLNVGDIGSAIKELRRPIALGSGDDRSQAGESQPGPVTPPQERARPSINESEMRDLVALLNEMTDQLRVRLPPVDGSTARTLMAAARQKKPESTPSEVVWFLRDKFVGSPTRFRTWGGAVFAVRAEFGSARR